MKNTHTVFFSNKVVVITIVVFFVGGTMRSLLLNRKESILSNIQQVALQAANIEQNYLKAQNKYKKASEEVIEIDYQTEKLIKQKQKENQIKIAEDIQKLEELKKLAIYYQRQKIEIQIFKETVDFIMRKTNQNLKKKLLKENQKSLNISSIQQLHQLNKIINN